jgi:transposase
MSKKSVSAVVEPSEPSPKSRRFTDEFKRDSVRLVTDEKYTFQAAATAVGVSQKSLRDWHAKFAPKPVPCDEHASLNELREENQRLRQQLRRAEMEREILKKATAYFARESL